jgi:transposase
LGFWGCWGVLPWCVLCDVSVTVSGEVVETTAYWRERALWAEARAVAAEERTEELAGELREVKASLATLSRMVFGRSSEKTGTCGDAGRQGEKDAGETGGERVEKKRGQRRGSTGHGRRDYRELDTEVVVVDLPADQRWCGCCGEPLEALGFKTCEQIDWLVKVTRIEYRRMRYRRRCPCAGPRTVIAAAAGASLVPKGRFTVGFAVRLVFEKYVLGLPVQRIVRSLAAQGLEVSEGTLSGVMGQAAVLVAPLAAAIRARNATSAHLHVDETTWRVFEQVEGKDGHRWWLWVFVAADTVAFVMAPSRSMSVLKDHLGIEADAQALPAGRELVLSSDFYVAYQSVGALEGVHSLWCWAHVRRHVIRAGDSDKALRPWCDAWLVRFAALYVAHHAMAHATPGTPDYARAAADFETALQVIDVVRRQQMKVSCLRPAAAKALATLDREWDGLVAHRDFPDLPLDNNAAERSLRAPVVGRKNYYGHQARWSAEMAADLWTITGTAERCGIEPLGYLREYLQACARAGGKPLQGAALEPFLPWVPVPGTGSRDDDPPLLADHIGEVSGNTESHDP